MAFAFFDDYVSAETKSKMVDALNKQSDEEPVKRVSLDSTLIPVKELEDFVTSNTSRLFSLTGIPHNFLNKNVDQWEFDESYLSAKATVRSMRVTNDIAERGVALMEEFKVLTNDEEQKQFLLQVVKHYRQVFPDRKKETLIQQVYETE